MDNGDMVFKKFTITLPEDVLEQLEKMAQEEDRTKSNMVRHLIKHYKKD